MTDEKETDPPIPEFLKRHFAYGLNGSIYEVVEITGQSFRPVALAGSEADAKLIAERLNGGAA